MLNMKIRIGDIVLPSNGNKYVNLCWVMEISRSTFGNRLYTLRCLSSNYGWIESNFFAQGFVKLC